MKKISRYCGLKLIILSIVLFPLHSQTSSARDLEETDSSLVEASQTKATTDSSVNHYQYDASKCGHFSKIGSDAFSYLIHSYVDSTEYRSFFSTCHELRKYEHVKTGLVNADQLDVPWYQLDFKTPFGKAHFNFVIFRLLSIFHRAFDIVNQFDCSRDMEWRMELCKADYESIRHEFDNHLEKKLKINAEYLKVLTEEARSLYTFKYSQNVVTKTFGVDWFEMQERHPITLVCQWLIYYINLPASKKTSYGYGCAGTTKHRVIHNSPLLLEYTGIIEKMFKQKDPQLTSLYGLHAYIFFMHSGELTNEGIAIANKQQDLKTQLFGGDSDQTLVYGYEPGTLGWLYHPVFKRLVREAARSIIDYDPYQELEYRCLQLADDFMDKEMILDTFQKMFPEGIDQKIQEVAQREQNRFEDKFPFAKPPLIKSLFNTGHFGIVVKILSMLNCNQFIEKTVKDHALYERYWVWSLLCLGRTAEARNILEMSKRKLTEQSSVDQFYEYYRCLVNSSNFATAIIHLSSFRNLTQEQEAYRIWCCEQLKKEQLEGGESIAQFTNQFLKKYSQMDLAYHFAHFDRDMEILTKALSKG